MQKRYLGIDYGRAQVGLALATSPLAEPLYSVSLEKAVSTINQLVLDHQVDVLVFGLSEGPIGEETKEFAKQFEASIEIDFVDETLSTQDAQKSLRHKKKSVRRGADHHFAAAILLQQYLDFNQTSYA